jgi:tRNA dimethylallyltransferase
VAPDPANDLLRRRLVGWLAGPTAVGKTEVALRLAERRGWTILSLDSRQVYRRLDRGTAKPSAEERARVPHLLLDCLDPTERCSAGRFRALALEALASLDSRDRSALAVGGAGLYWEALTRPMHPLPAASEEIRARHETIVRLEGVAGLYRRLAAADPETAQRLPPGDRQRVSRALEVCEITGLPLSRWIAEERAPALELPVVALVREPAELRERIAARCARMLASGLLEEIRGLLASGVPPDAPGLRTVGYREFLPHLLQGAPFEACRNRFVRNSWQYARRQMTWLRGRVPGHRPVRLSAATGLDDAVRAVEALLAAAPSAPRGAAPPTPFAS